MKLAVCTIVKNEAAKYLGGLLFAWREFADEIIAIDDNSEDNTLELLQDAGAIVESTKFDTQMWGNEAGPRKQLWNLAVNKSSADWFIFLDGDMIPAQDPKPLMQVGVDGIAFPLYDLWSEDEYREDQFWQAHKHHRLWAVRNPDQTFQPIWADRGIHCGHLPVNLRLNRILQAPHNYAILHYSYADPRDRKFKHAQYMSQEHQLSEQEFAHANSIIDPTPILKPLDIDIRWPIKRSS